MKNLIIALLFLPVLAFAQVFYSPEVTMEEWNSKHPTPYGIAAPKTEQQLIKELYITILQLRVELTKLQILQQL